MKINKLFILLACLSLSACSSNPSEQGNEENNNQGQNENNNQGNENNNNNNNNENGNGNNNNQEIKVTEIKEEKKVSSKVEEKVNKDKKSFSLSSKQKDLVLVLLVLVLLVVGFVLTTPKKEKIDIELPVALSGETGFTEISYNEYVEKVNNNELFLMIIVRDGCGYCEMYEPIVQEVANEYNLPIYYINLTNLSSEEVEELSTTNKYLKKNQKWGTPTTLFMYGENVVDSISGYVEKDTFVEFVKENFKVEE